MSDIDWVPGLVHGKIAFQLLTGDVKGAERSNENFVRGCPGVSQVTSTIQLMSGDTKGAVETQKRCLNTVDNIANKIPVTGYPKAAFHHVTGNHEARNRAFNAATKSTVAIGAAAATGGAGAVVAKIGANVTYDLITSTITNKEQGTVKNVIYACKNPSAGSIYDATYSVGKPAFKKAILGSNPWGVFI